MIKCLSKSFEALFLWEAKNTICLDDKLYIIKVNACSASKGVEILLRGFYTAATGMIAQQRRTEMLTNNLSNARTPGFKADQSSMRAFPEMLIQRFDKTNIPTEKGLNLPINSFVGGLNTGVYMQEATPTFKQGNVQETGNKTDIALIDVAMPVNEENGKNGSVFYTVMHQGAICYTRNGNFTLDQQKYLTTPGGYYVLDAQGQRIQLNSDQFTVNNNGDIYENGQFVASLGVAYAENPYALVKESDGMYYSDGGQLPIANNVPGVQFSLQQGVLEQSNVDPSRTMTDMMTAYRAFEANQKILQAYDRSLEKAVNEVGRI